MIISLIGFIVCFKYSFQKSYTYYHLIIMSYYYYFHRHSLIIYFSSQPMKMAQKQFIHNSKIHYSSFRRWWVISSPFQPVASTVLSGKQQMAHGWTYLQKIKLTFLIRVTIKTIMDSQINNITKEWHTFDRFRILYGSNRLVLTIVTRGLARPKSLKTIKLPCFWSYSREVAPDASQISNFADVLREEYI